jgi:hypothetical protein
MRVTSVPGLQPRWVRQKKLTNSAGVICGNPSAATSAVVDTTTFGALVTDGCDGPPLAVGFELDGFALTSLAVPAVRVGSSLPGRVLR